MTAPASPSAPAAPAPRRFPRWAIALIAAGVLGGLATCAIGALTLLGSRVQAGPVIATDGQSQVTAPMLWARATNLSDHATIQVVGPREEQFLYVVTTGKTETGPITLQDYAGHMLDAMRDQFGDPAISPAREVTVGGRPALRYELDARRPGDAARAAGRRGGAAGCAGGAGELHGPQQPRLLPAAGHGRGGDRAAAVALASVCSGVAAKPPHQNQL